jgi:HD-GYP domain-containing protein (c-di-GMP phosphodiesterase class II)
VTPPDLTTRRRRLLHARRPSALAFVVVLLVALGAGAAITFGGLFSGAERATVAARFELRRSHVPKDVVVVGVDDITFNDLRRQWPFPRSLHARVIDRLHAAGARAIAYDVQFTEPTKPREDLALYDSIGRAGGAVLATAESDGHGHTNVLGGDANLREVHARAAVTNLTHDANGSITRFPRAVSGVPSFPVAVAERLGVKLPAAGFNHGQALIDYRGGPGNVPTLPFSSVLRGQFDPRAVRGKVVVVGAVDPTLQDVHATPAARGKLMSGPEIEANAIWTALHGLPLRQAPVRFDLFALLLLVLVPLAVRVRWGVLATLLAAPGAAAVLLVGAQLAFDSGLVLAVVGPLVAGALAAIGVVVASYRAENRERRRLSSLTETLSRDVQLRTEELEDTQLDVVRRLAAAVESRDAETGSHVERISHMCEQLALAVGVGPIDAEMMRHAAALHDMGKIAIPDHVLLKPGKLDAAEWELMKSHATAGAGLLAGSRSPLLQLAEVIARTHHERWDGSGYPAALAGEEIPLSGRICSICDAYDALVSKRPYKDATSTADALDEIVRCAGTQFDPLLVERFVELVRTGAIESRPHPDDELEHWELRPPARDRHPR